MLEIYVHKFTSSEKKRLVWQTNSEINIKLSSGCSLLVLFAPTSFLERESRVHMCLTKLEVKTTIILDPFCKRIWVEIIQGAQKKVCSLKRRRKKTFASANSELWKAKMFLVNLTTQVSCRSTMWALLTNL